MLSDFTDAESQLCMAVALSMYTNGSCQSEIAGALLGIPYVSVEKILNTMEGNFKFGRDIHCHLTFPGPLFPGPRLHCGRCCTSMAVRPGTTQR